MAFLGTDVRSVVELDDVIQAADGILPRTLLDAQLTPIALALPYLATDDIIDHFVVLELVRGAQVVAFAPLPLPAGTGLLTGSVVVPGQGPFSNLSTPTPIGPGVAVQWRVLQAVTAGKKVTLQLTAGVF